MKNICTKYSCLQINFLYYYIHILNIILYRYILCIIFIIFVIINNECNYNTYALVLCVRINKSIYKINK